ncbi:TetR family transcriptional regulator [soil metagenome]
MSDGILTREAILAATEEVLRKYGPAKATVVDVARVLGVSHGTVYRHFPTKVALREAVTKSWLDRSHDGLTEIARADRPADVRLVAWQIELFKFKKQKALVDPELFATYSTLAREHSDVAIVHIAELIEQVKQIVDDGVAEGIFATADSLATAKAIFDATIRFHDPVHAAEWTDPNIGAELDAVCALILDGLRPRPT